MNTNIEELIKNLRTSPDRDLRRQSAGKLGRIQGESAYKALIEALRDSDNEVKQTAVIALGKFNKPEVVKELMKPFLLQNEDFEIRWSTVQVISKLGGNEVIDALEKLLKDKDWLVRTEAQLGLMNQITRLKNKPSEDNIKELVRLLNIDDDEIRQLVIESLSEMDEKYDEFLISHLQINDPITRSGLASSLGLKRSKKAVEPLIELLKDENKITKCSAIKALGQIRSEKAIEPLVEILNSDDSECVETASKALVEIGPPAVDNLIENLLYATNKFVKVNIISTLGKIGDERAIPLLIKEMGSTYSMVRTAVMKALIRFGNKVVNDLIKILTAKPIPIDDLLDFGLNSPDKTTRLNTIKALGELRNYKAIEPLEKIYGNADYEEQQVIINAQFKIACAAWARNLSARILGEIKDESAIPALIQGLDDLNMNVRLQCLRSLKQMQSKKAIEKVMEVALSDESIHIRIEALESLPDLNRENEKAIDLAIKSLEDKNKIIRLTAVRALGRFVSEKAINSLINSLKDSNWSIHFYAEMALCNYGTKIIDRIKELLNSDDPVFRHSAIYIISKIGDQSHIKLLEDFINGPKADEQNRKDALRYIKEIKQRLDKQK